MDLFKWLFRKSGGRNAGEEKPENKTDMKRFLIACLGNIGPDYVGTRHNAGFMIGDAIAGEAGVPFESCRYGDMAKVKVKNCELLLLKPSTFMNLSGTAVRFWMNKEKLPLENLLVLVDDIALPFGAIRIRKKALTPDTTVLKISRRNLETLTIAG